MELWKARVIDIFKSKASLPSEATDDLMRSWNHQTLLKRNDFLIQKGQIESNLFFVVAGSLRIYFPHNDEEICVGFAHDHNLICS